MTISGASEKIPGQLWDKGGALLNVMHPDFGATGLGVADDYAAFAAALAALPAKGGIIYVPPGTYKLATNLAITPDATAFDGGYIHIVMAPGAKLKPTSAVTECISFNAACSQEAWLGISGGVIDGTNGAAAMVGIGIHTQNVKVRQTTVKYCKGAGVKYFYDLAAPPICSELNEISTLFNKIGVYCAVSASGLKITGGRIEGSDEEGVLLQDMGHFSISDDAVIELNGYVTAAKPNLRIKGVCYGSVLGSYFESVPYQDHSSVVIEANASQPRGILFAGNIVTGYNSTVAGVPLANSIGLDIAPGSGVTDTVVAFGNTYVGQTTNVRNGTNSRGYLLGPDGFGDTSGGGTAWSGATTYAVRDVVLSGGNSYVCKLSHTNQIPPNGTYWTAITLTRYSRVSVLAGRVNDVNAYASTTYDLATLESITLNNPTLSGTVTASGGVKYTGGTSVDGSIVKLASLGLAVRGIAGSSYDWAILGAGGTSAIQGPTGTTVAEFFASIKYKTATITYSTSMTPNADAGEIQKITVTDAVAFAINAPTNPRLGQRLAIRLRNISGGAHGAITPNAIYKLAGSAWPVVANGSSKTLIVDYDGTNWVEQTRSATDIPN